MAEGGSVEIGDGFVKITSKVDDKGIKRDAERSGDKFQDTFSKAVEDGARRRRPRLVDVWRRTGGATSDGFYKGADGRWRDGENRFVASADVTGNRFGSRLVKGFTGVVGGIVKGAASAFSSLRGAIGPIVGPLGAIVPMLSIIGPLLANASVAVWNFGAGLLAAAPALLAVRGQLKIITALVESFAEAIGKEMSPITTAFKEAHKEASALATDGLRPLAEEFVRVNFGSVRTLLSSVATTTNEIVKGFMNWANSARGVQAVHQITQGVIKLYDGLAPSIVKMSTAFLEMFGRISDVSAAAGVKGLGGVLQWLTDLFNGITAETVQGGLRTTRDNFVAIGNAIKTVVDFGRGVVEFYQRFRTQIQLTIDVLGVLAIVFGGPVTAAIAAAGLIIRHWSTVKALFEQARGWFSGIEGGSQILDRLKVIATNVWLALQRAFFTIRDAVEGPLRRLAETLQTQLFPAFGNLMTVIGPLIPVLIDKLAPAIGVVLKNFINMINFAARVVTAIVNFVAKVVIEAQKLETRWNKTKTFFRNLPGEIIGFLASLPGRISAIFVSMTNKALYQVGYMIGQTISRLRQLPGKAASAVASLWSAMSGAFSRSTNNARSGASRLVSGTVSFFRQLPGKARSAISATPGRIKSVFSGSGSWLVSAGRNILMGLVRGMKGAVGEAVNTSVNAAKSVISGLKSGLGINSPSKVAEEEVGRWVPPGLARGVKKAMPAAQREIAAMAPRAATAATAATMAAPSTTTSTSNATRVENLNVNVRGVLDPSDPVALRRMIAGLYEELAKYERSYA